MKKILLFTEYEKFLNSKDFFLFSNKTFFKEFIYKKSNVHFKFIQSLKQSSEIRYIDEIEANKIVKSIENDLFKSLNNLHLTNFSNRYWKIIIGHWLDRFVKLVSFRLKIVENCQNFNKEFDLVYLSKNNDYSLVINQTFDIWLASLDKEWNFNLFSKIYNLAFPDNIDYKNVKTNNFEFRPNVQNNINTKKEFLKNKVQKTLSFFNYLSKKNKIAFKTTHLSFYNEVKLNLLNNDFPSMLHNESYKNEITNPDLRSKINIKDNNSNKLEKILRIIIPDALPKTVVENYNSIFDKTLKCNWPKKPKIIFTSNSYDGDDFFKVWAAYLVEKKNSKYVIGQHGIIDVSEKLLKNSIDYQVCDYYLRWGEKKYDKDIELFNFKNSNKKINFNIKNKILVIARTTGHEVETYSRLDEFNIYHNCLKSLLMSFSEKVRKETIVRLKRTFKWTNKREFEYLKNKFEFLKIDTGEKNISSVYKKTKLAIFMYYSSGCLETISLDIPTMIYCPIDIVYQDKNEKKYFDILKSCKILSLNVDEFLINTNNVISDIQKWWYSDEVLKAKKEFLNRYSKNKDTNHVKTLSNLLKKL